jgi:hypothetical protein
VGGLAISDPIPRLAGFGVGKLKTVLGLRAKDDMGDVGRWGSWRVESVALWWSLWRGCLGECDERGDEIE